MLQVRAKFLKKKQVRAKYHSCTTQQILCRF